MIEFEREGSDFDMMDKAYMDIKKVYADKEASIAAGKIEQLSKGIKLSDLLEIKDNLFVQKLITKLGTRYINSRLSSEATEGGDIYVVVRDGKVGAWIGGATYVLKTKYWDPTDENFEIGEILFSEVN